MTSNDATRVILVEDDELLRTSLASLLGLSGFAVTAVGDGLSFYRALADGVFEVAVIDLLLPDQAGETLIEYLRRNTTIPIIVITARDTLDTRVDCYKTGADLFLGKPVDGRELAAAIASLADRRRREADLSPAPAASPSWELLTVERALVSPEGRKVELTGREWNLLATIAANPGRTTTKSELVAAIYQRDDDGAEHALAMLVGRTRQKIEDQLGCPSPIMTEYGVGYRLGGRVAVRPA